MDFAQLYCPFGELPLWDLKDSSDFLKQFFQYFMYICSCCHLLSLLHLSWLPFIRAQLSNNLVYLLPTYTHVLASFNQLHSGFCPLAWLKACFCHNHIVTIHFHMDPMVTFLFSANVLSKMHLTSWHFLSLNSFLSLFSYNLLSICWGRLVLGIKNGTVKQGGCVFASE